MEDIETRIKGDRTLNHIIAIIKNGSSSDKQKIADILSLCETRNKEKANQALMENLTQMFEKGDDIKLTNFMRKFNLITIDDMVHIIKKDEDVMDYIKIHFGNSGRHVLKLNIILPTHDFMVMQWDDCGNFVINGYCHYMYFTDIVKNFVERI